MRIKSLKLHNFGVYAGDNEFVFSGTKPIVLIGGMNGRGKTTFLEAILLALYGPNSFAYIESEYKVYTQYLRSYVNRDASDNNCRIELVFELYAGIEIETYRVIREWEGFSKRINETLTVYKDEEYSEFLSENWPMFVENILPSALSNLFFFDGEKIAELAVDNTNEQLKKAIRSMLGISVLDVLQSDIHRNIKRYEKKMTGDSKDELSRLGEEMDGLEHHIFMQESIRDQIQLELDANNSKRELLYQMYSSRGGVATEKRQEIIQKRSNIYAELELLKNKVVDLSGSELPLNLVRKLLYNIDVYSSKENDSKILNKSFDILSSLRVNYANETGTDISETAGFMDFIADYSKKVNVEQIYGLSDHASSQLTLLMEGKLRESVNETKESLKREKTLKKQRDELDSYTNLDIDNRELEELKKEIKKVEAEIIKQQVDLSNLSNEISSSESDLRGATFAYNQARDEFLTNAEYQDSAQRVVRTSTMLVNVIDRFMVELQKRKAELLGSTITDCYKKLASKRNLINSIIMNPKTLGFVYYSDDGKIIPQDSLSAGEKQVMIISILWALGICSKQKLPVIIDTPLSRLDSSHRKTIIQKYFPNASQQTIILSTDSEVNESYYQMMKNDIGDEYTLVYDENTKSTSIKKGYEMGE